MFKFFQKFLTKRKNEREDQGEDMEGSLFDDWNSFLHTYNSELLNTEEVKASVSEDVLVSGWMGYPGATEEQIKASERRLGVQFPRSLRDFYKITNGWRCAGYYSDAVFPFEILQVEKVEWFHVNNQEWIDIYNEYSYEVSDKDYFVYGKQQNTGNFRVDYLHTALVISTIHDSGVYLLNPKIITEDSEWEAWHFADWYPGASRYQSFFRLMQSERNTFTKLIK